VSVYFSRCDHDNQVRHSIASAAHGVIFGMVAERTGDSPIVGHPGRGHDVLRDGMKRICVPDPKRWQEAAEVVSQRYLQASRWCESPIEREMLAALLTADWSFFEIDVPAVLGPNDTETPAAAVVIAPQFKVGRYRLDLGILVCGANGRASFGVECDGADYHEARADAARDRELAAAGVRVMRASGAQIRAAPLALADTFVRELPKMMRLL
jgi:hypothetical protein